MIALFLALSFIFTNPSFRGYCDPNGIPLTDLAVIRLYYRPIYGQDQLILERGVIGQEGKETRIDVGAWTGTGTFWVVGVDMNGKPSCKSNMVDVNWPTTDVVPIPRASTTVWYDIQGRRYGRKPKVPGVYIEETNGVKKKIVILFVRV